MKPPQGLSSPNVTHFRSKWFPGSGCRCSSPLVRLSGFLERGRPRPLNPPLMQTQSVFGLA